MVISSVSAETQDPILQPEILEALEFNLYFKLLQKLKLSYHQHSLASIRTKDTYLEQPLL
jgi:hypothetical protein